ncbi:TetR/AcrR family transcriptional regulator [Rhodococcus sp. IEGM 1374]|uniref:TetR/AcrR family transcriptional regulator n=1 Tax=Rhodococcus sp. IEGM 1374 TaxID=3082221 RepID=UPI0029547BF0|nr:TetR/AcrR family transcriptional regulator [Rhodococcus sp. IEGM 1374]MDV7991631.1 TetR/AcrR family transcriptional regulator [Rhodococcus sp. IEGM 1374]
MTQQRAIDTRADLLAGAAREFARYGYAAASVNNILANTACTKGAMYFHFASKREMAEAILDTATKVYTRIGRHWAIAEDVRPLDALAGMVDDAGEAFVNETALRAEARISLEPEFLERRPWTAWEHSAVELASRAAESDRFTEGFTPEKFVRVLSASLAGHRLLAHIVPTEVSDSVRHGYTESFQIVVAAATRRAQPDPTVADRPSGQAKGRSAFDVQQPHTNRAESTPC